MNKLTTKNIIYKAKRLEGKTLREVLQLEKSGDSENIMKNKSNFARFIERDYFNLPIPKVNQPLRIALVGSTISPSLGLTLELFGKDKSLERIEKAIEFIS